MRVSTSPPAVTLRRRSRPRRQTPRVSCGCFRRLTPDNDLKTHPGMTLRVVPSHEQLLSAVDRMSSVEASRFFVSGSTYPRFLYKFSPGDRLEALVGLIVTSSVWLSSPLAFNDPFDLRLSVRLVGSLDDQIRFVARQLRRHIPDLAQRPDESRVRAVDLIGTGTYLSEMQKAFELEASSFGIACFVTALRPIAQESTLQPTVQQTGARDILMWSHYARNHEGLCFQFRTRSAPALFAWLRPIEYKDDVLTANWRDRVERGEKIFAALYRKSPVWSYEREYRLAFPGRANTTEPFKPQALVGIIFGCRAKSELVDEVTSLCLRRARAGHPPIRLFRARESSTRYRLRIERASDLEASCVDTSSSAA